MIMNVDPVQGKQPWVSIATLGVQLRLQMGVYKYVLNPHELRYNMIQHLFTVLIYPLLTGTARL